MRKQPLTPNLVKKKENLLSMGENIRSYKRQIVALQNDLSETKDDETKALLRKELQKLSKRQNRMKTVYRYCHVAYSELRGTPRSKIEQNVVRAPALSEGRISYFKKC